jgi:hypothetical protein
MNLFSESPDPLQQDLDKYYWTLNKKMLLELFEKLKPVIEEFINSQMNKRFAQICAIETLVSMISSMAFTFNKQENIPMKKIMQFINESLKRYNKLSLILFTQENSRAPGKQQKPDGKR